MEEQEKMKCFCRLYCNFDSNASIYIHTSHWKLHWNTAKHLNALHNYRMNSNSTPILDIPITATPIALHNDKFQVHIPPLSTATIGLPPIDMRTNQDNSIQFNQNNEETEECQIHEDINQSKWEKVQEIPQSEYSPYLSFTEGALVTFAANCFLSRDHLYKLIDIIQHREFNANAKLGKRRMFDLLSNGFGNTNCYAGKEVLDNDIAHGDNFYSKTMMDQCKLALWNPALGSLLKYTNLEDNINDQTYSDFDSGSKCKEEKFEAKCAFLHDKSIVYLHDHVKLWNSQKYNIAPDASIKIQHFSEYRNSILFSAIDMQNQIIPSWIYLVDIKEVVLNDLITQSVYREQAKGLPYITLNWAIFMDGFGRSKKVSYHPMTAVYCTLLNVPPFVRRTNMASKFHCVVKDEDVNWTQIYRSLSLQFDYLKAGMTTYSAFLETEVIVLINRRYFLTHSCFWLRVIISRQIYIATTVEQ